MTPAARKFLLPLHLWAGLTVEIMIGPGAADSGLTKLQLRFRLD
jgi:hypothetical protein